MFAKLKKRAEFLFVREGDSVRGYHLVVQARQVRVASNDIKVGFTATKRIGNAVARNRAKRRLRALAEDVLLEFGKPGWDYVFIARMSVVSADWAAIKKDASKVFQKLPDHNCQNPNP